MPQVIFDAHQDRSNIFAVERRSATKQNVKQDTTGPIINLFPIFSRNYLRSQVHSSSFGLIFKLLVLEDLGNTEVNQLDAL